MRKPKYGIGGDLAAVGKVLELEAAGGDQDQGQEHEELPDVAFAGADHGPPLIGRDLGNIFADGTEEGLGRSSKKASVTPF